MVWYENQNIAIFLSTNNGTFIVRIWIGTLHQNLENFNPQYVTQSQQTSQLVLHKTAQYIHKATS